MFPLLFLREAKEETCLDIELICQLHTYSDPSRDPRQHTISTVYVGRGRGEARAEDDAADIGIFREDSLPDNIVFDHRQILEDYFRWKKES